MLSEAPAIVHGITDGDLVGVNLEQTEVVLTPKEMADALHDFGSQPGFFQLDDGNPVTQ